MFLAYSLFFIFSDFEIQSAVTSNHLEILKLFLKARGDKTRLYYGNTYGYGGYNKEDENPVIVVYPDGSKFSILHVAAYYGSLNITTYYKDVLGFSDINPKDNNGNTPLSWASYFGHLEIAKYYINNGYKASGEQGF